MAYRVLIDGVPIECDTPADALALASIAREKGRPPVIASQSNQESGNSSSSRWTEARLKDFLKLIDGSRQMKFVNLLLEHPDGRTDKTILQELGLSKGKELAGVLAGVAKNVKKANVGAPTELYHKYAVSIGSERVNEYKVNDSFRTAFERWGKKS